MWKFVSRGIRESIERRACRTNVYSQSNGDGNGNDQPPEKPCHPCRLLAPYKQFLAPGVHNFYHGTRAKRLGPRDQRQQEQRDAKYTWSDAVGWSSVLAIGYVVCQSLCIKRSLFDIDNAKLDNWRNNLLVNPPVQASKFFFLHFLLPQAKYILPISKEPIQSKQADETLIDNAATLEVQYGPITAQEAFQEAVDNFSYTHETIIGELALDCGSQAIEEKRYEDAVEHFTVGSQLSSPGSMFNLALCFELGLGTTMDNTKAAEYYQKAADKGHADAMYNLGVFHSQGKGGLKVDLVAAKELFTRAAQKGQAQALKALEIERSFKKYSSPKRESKNQTQYTLEVKLISNKVENNVVTKLINYEILSSHWNNPTDSDHFINSYEESRNFKTSTDIFLDMLGIQEQSAIPLLSVGENGP